MKISNLHFKHWFKCHRPQQNTINLLITKCTVIDKYSSNVHRQRSKHQIIITNSQATEVVPINIHLLINIKTCMISNNLGGGKCNLELICVVVIPNLQQLFYTENMHITIDMYVCAFIFWEICKVHFRFMFLSI